MTTQRWPEQVYVIEDPTTVWPLLNRDPIASCMVASRMMTTAGQSQLLGGQLWTFASHHPSLCFVSDGAGIIIPLYGDDHALEAFAHRLITHFRGCGSIVGPAALVLALWSLIEPSWGAARQIYAHQPLLALQTMPQCGLDTHLRQAHLDELDLYVEATTKMFIEEIGIDPCAHDQGRNCRAQVQNLIRQGRAWGRFDQGEVLFKADIGAQAPKVSQIQGVWVPPTYRNQGLATAGTAMLAAIIHATGRIASLYVNDFNTAALSVYHKIGFTQVGTFATILVS